MGTYLNVGNDGFRAIRKGHYVDKTGLISFMNRTLGTKQKLTCVSRPRRFGKSFAAQMLCAYYDRSCDSRVLFEDLMIFRDDSFEKHLNKYDVLYLDITLFITNAYDIKNTVTDIVSKVVAELRGMYPDAEPKQNLIETLNSVVELSGSKFIIIIDEWDALFREAKYDEELQKEYIRLLRSLFKSSLTDKAIEAAYMTGILPIKKYGTQSALTDFKEYTMTMPKKLAEYVGFTEEEVKNLCKEYQMDFEKMKRWYDGYSFSRIKSIYSPNSVMEAVNNEEFGTYWTASETYESLKIYIDMDEDGLKESIVQMLGGAHFKIDTGSFQNDFTSIHRKDDVLTLLVHLGYLAYDAEEKAVYIPNEEVRLEFIRAVETGRHKEIARLLAESDRLLENTLSLDEESVAVAIETAHNAGTAPLFYNNEQALRSVVRFAYISCIDAYREIQELPSGKGYADIVFIPKRNSDKPAMLIELKWNKTADGAVEQIKKNNYPKALDGLADEVLLVGISYDEKSKKHSCKIEKYTRGRGDFSY